MLRTPRRVNCPAYINWERSQCTRRCHSAWRNDSPRPFLCSTLSTRSLRVNHFAGIRALTVSVGLNPILAEHGLRCVFSNIIRDRGQFKIITYSGMQSRTTRRPTDSLQFGSSGLIVTPWVEHLLLPKGLVSLS